mmetsp:Transcript_97152/g.274794  ORF Transcript_97152/g.274794 Transcript_97152/m.274794 type:complete len:253 (-) Transcript_97152:97-855(-)
MHALRVPVRGQRLWLSGALRRGPRSGLPRGGPGAPGGPAEEHGHLRGRVHGALQRSCLLRRPQASQSFSFRRCLRRGIRRRLPDLPRLRPLGPRPLRRARAGQRPGRLRPQHARAPHVAGHGALRHGVLPARLRRPPGRRAAAGGPSLRLGDRPCERVRQSRGHFHGAGHPLRRGQHPRPLRGRLALRLPVRLLPRPDLPRADYARHEEEEDCALHGRCPQSRGAGRGPRGVRLRAGARPGRVGPLNFQPWW